MQGNQAYSTANERNITVHAYEEISPNWASGEVDIFNTRTNEAYQTNTVVLFNTNNEKVDEFYTKANEAYQMASAGTAVTYEEISHNVNSVNGQPDDAEVFTKANEAYQTSAAAIESKENEAYGLHLTSADAIESKENEAYGIHITNVQL